MSTPDTKVLYMIAILNETYIEELGLAICVSPLFTCRLVHCRQVEDMRNLNKKSFYFVTLTPSQSGWKPLFIGVSVVRVRVRVRGEKWRKDRSIDNTTKKTKRFLVTKLWAPEQDDVTKKVYYRNVPLKVKISNDLFFHLNKILYLCSQ